MQLASHVTNPIFYVQDTDTRKIKVVINAAGYLLDFYPDGHEVEASEEIPSTPQDIEDISAEILTYLQSLTWLDSTSLVTNSVAVVFSDEDLAVAALPPHHLTDLDDVPQSCAALVPYDDTRYFAFNFDKNDGVGAILNEETGNDRIMLFDSHGIRVGAIAMSNEVDATCRASLAQHGGVLSGYTIAGQLSNDQALLWWYV